MANTIIISILSAILCIPAAFIGWDIGERHARKKFNKK